MSTDTERMDELDDELPEYEVRMTVTTEAVRRVYAATAERAESLALGDAAPVEDAGGEWVGDLADVDVPTYTVDEVVQLDGGEAE